MAKAVTVNFEITNQSFQKLNDIMKKFNLEWDTKVFKSIDKLNSNLEELSERIFKLNERMAKQRLTKAQQKGTGTGAGIQFDMDKFFDEFGKEMNKVTVGMSAAADAISKLKVNVTGSSSSIGDEKAERDASTAGALVADGQRKIAQQKLRDDNRKVSMAMDHRLKQERLMTRHMMQMFGGGMIGGSLGLMLGQLGEGIGGKFKKAQANKEYAETEEGQDQLNFQRSAMGAKNPLAGFGKGGGTISKEWQEKGVSAKGLAEVGSASGRAKSWMGRRVEGAQTGDMGKMFGGKKGMAIAGGAIAGVGILKKAISLGIESSPMMQQMMKLWKFGIMMIFRPIGDFFGFFLRPIMVMMLRKFIIPFYQEYLPLMQTLGHDLGTKVVGLLEAIAVLFTGYTEPETYDTAARMTMARTNEENLQDAMAQSLADNETYWEELFKQLGYIPAWFEKAIGGIPQSAPVDEPAKAPSHTTDQEAASNPITNPSSAFYESRFAGLDRDLSGETPPPIHPDKIAQTQKEFAESLTTNEGLLAAQSSSTGTTNWTINMYSNISGAGTEEVNEKIEEEIEKLPAKIEEETQKQIEKKYGRVNPRA